jgi:lipid-A-disaccharide synthase
MRYYLIAGEASGDLHAANLMREMKQFDAKAEFRFFGGELMQAQGGELVKHYRDMAFMGLIDVLANLRTIRKNLKSCEADLLNYKPDVLILVDYPGFNLRMAEFAHKQGIKVFYYISPKLWAWNRSRVKKIKAYVDKLFTILPFETEFYQQYGVEVIYSGNPVLDAIDNRTNKDESTEEFISRNELDDRPIVGILAGSRRQELKWNLPDMLAMVRRFPEYQFVIAGAPSFTLKDYEPFVAGHDVKVLFNQTYQIVQHSRAAMVTSGTATLETALLNCPQVVCYKMWGGKFSDFVARNFIIKVPYVSLVNLILNREGVKELFQRRFTLDVLEQELRLLLTNDEYRSQMFSSYRELQEKMGGPGSSGRTAASMLECLTQK